MNHYPHHIGDFAKDTMGFSQGAIGAYRLLMDAYYANEEAPPIDDVYVIGRATTPAERKNVDKALTKFERRDGHYFHKRVEEELAAFRVRSKEATDKANLRWEKERAKKDAEGNAGSNADGNADGNATASTGHEPEHPLGNAPAMLTSNHKPIQKQNPAPPDGGATLEFVWDEGAKFLVDRGAFPSTERAKSFIGRLLKTWPEDEVRDALLAAERAKGDPKGYVLAVLESKPKKQAVPTEAQPVLKQLRAQFGDDVQVHSSGGWFYSPRHQFQWELDGRKRVAL